METIVQQEASAIQTYAGVAPKSAEADKYEKQYMSEYGSLKNSTVDC